MPLADPTKLADPERLESLVALCLLDTPADPAFDRLTQLAASILDVPVALVSLLDTNRQFFKSQVGLPSHYAQTRETPLSHSFCQHVVVQTAPLIIDDARSHPLVHDNPAISDLDVVAYAGIPLTTSSGHAVGSFCVIDHKPRHWTQREISILTELANSVMTEVELHAEIIERQRIEAALRDSEERYRTVVTAMNEGIIHQDWDGVIQTSNPSAERILGLSVDQMMGLAPFDPGWRAIREDGSPFLNLSESHPAQLALRTGNPQTNIIMGVYKPDNSLTWIMSHSQPLVHPEESQPHGVVTSIIDITERKKSEHQALLLQLEKDRADLLTQFIQQSSHQFRTPLAIIQSSMYVMDKTDDPDKRRIKVGIIEAQIRRITRLVELLQKMSRLDSQVSLTVRPTNINYLVREVMNRVAAQELRRVGFERDLNPDIPVINVDPDLLGDALSQIMDNAVQFSPEGGMVKVTTYAARDAIGVAITDHGSGIPADVLPRIFERFYRQDSANSTPGFGLGLPIAQVIVEMHGGAIKVDTAVGHGTTFTIELPLNIQSSPADAAWLEM